MRLSSFKEIIRAYLRRLQEVIHEKELQSFALVPLFKTGKTDSMFNFYTRVK